MFKFSDAQCPLASVNALSIVGQTGYNPFNFPLPGLTLLDPAWNAQCYAANFRANDPPHALTPTSNLSPFTTTTPNSVMTSKTASPSSGVPRLPNQTNTPTLSATSNPRSFDPINYSDPSALRINVPSLKAQTVSTTPSTLWAQDQDSSSKSGSPLTTSSDLSLIESLDSPRSYTSLPTTYTLLLQTLPMSP